MAKETTDVSADQAKADDKKQNTLAADSLDEREKALKAQDKAQQNDAAAAVLKPVVIDGVKPKVDKQPPLEEKSAQGLAAQLYVMTSLFIRDAKHVGDLLSGRSAADIKLLDEQFKKKYGVSLEEHLKDEFSAEEFKKIQELLHPKEVAKPAEPPKAADAPKPPEPEKPKSTVEDDGKGHVTKVSNEKGETREFKYDKTGTIIEMKGPEGQWKSKDGVHWKNEKGESINGVVDVKLDGTIKIPDGIGGSKVQKIDGSYTHVDKDGTIEVHKPDKSSVIIRDGHITRVTYPNGSFRDLEYDANGKLSKVETDGGSWTTTDGKHWKNEKGQVQELDISLDANGNYHVKDASGKDTISLIDGRKALAQSDGAVRVFSNDGKLSETIDANGRHQLYEFGADGKLAKFTTPDGILWQSQDGQNWSNGHGDKPWKVNVSVSDDGTRKLVDEKGTEITLKLDGTSEFKETNGHIVFEDSKGVRRTVQHAIDRDALEKQTDVIIKALPKEYKAKIDESNPHQGMQNLVNPISPKMFNMMLRDRTDAERKIIADIYKEKTGEELSAAIDRTLTGPENIRAHNLLDHGSNDRVGRVYADLLDHQMSGGLSAGKAEQDLRETISTMNAEELDALKKDYQERYGVNLEGVIDNDQHISKETKDLLKVYFKGTDHRAEYNDELLRLANVAVDKKKMWMFQEIFRDGNISDEARQKFIDDDGESKVKRAWGWRMDNGMVPLIQTKEQREEFDKLILETPDMRHALDYLKGGHLSIASQAKDNTGTFDDNEDAIKHAAVMMTQGDREEYFKGKALVENGLTWMKIATEGDKISAEDKKAYWFYTDNHDALTDPGNSTEVSEWEATILKKDQEVVSRIANCRHWYGDDRVRSIITSIEQMSKSDWELAKEDSDKGRRFKEMIAHTAETIEISDADKKRVRETLDRKLAADKYEDSNIEGRRTALEAMSDKQYDRNPYDINNPTFVINAMKNMTDAEKEQYRTDPEYRKKFNSAVDSYFNFSGTPGYEAIQYYLKEVERGENKPPSELQMKMEGYPTNRDGRMQYEWGLTQGYMTEAEYKRGKLIHDIEQSFQDDPKLRERLINPQTPEDKEMSERTLKTIHGKLKGDDYEKFVQPLLETGKLPIDKQVLIDKEYEGKHKKDVYDDLIKNPDELKRLREDIKYQTETLKPLSDPEREIALNVIEQGEVRPEDLARAAMIGKGADDSALLQVVNKGDQDYREALKVNYAHKYGEDLTWRGMDETSGGTERQFTQDIRRDPTSKYELYDESRMDVYRSREGFGSSWVDSVWDGTGFQVDDALNRWTSNLAEASAKHKELFNGLSVDEQRELQNNLYVALDNFKSSKGGMADALIDGTIAVTAIVGAAFTDGVSLALLTTIAVAGGTFKVLAKREIMGNDYDSSKAYVDFITGGIDAALSFVGPGEFAGVLGIGEKAAASATVKAVEEVGVVALEQGGEKVLEKGVQTVIRDAIVSGAPKVEEKALKEIAEKAIAKEITGAAREKAVQELTTALEKNLAKELELEARSWLTRKATEYAFVTGSGAAGGGMSGMVRGLTEWDMDKSFSENMDVVMQSTLMSGLSGGVGAGAFHTVFKVAGAGYRLATGKGGRVPTAAEAAELGVKGEVIATEGDFVLVRPKDAPAPQGEGIAVPPDQLKSGYKQIGGGDYYVDNQMHFYKMNEKGNLVPDENVHAAIKEDAVINSPEFNYVRMSKAEREGVWNRVKDQPMAQAQAIDGFLDHATSAVAGKENLTGLMEKAQVAEQMYARKLYQVNEEVIEPLVKQGKIKPDQVDNTELIKQQLGNDPERIKMLDDFNEARTQHAMAQKGMRDAASQRAGEVQAAMDKFADEHGLPRVKVKADFRTGASSGHYQDGVISLNGGDLLSGKRPADIAETMYHEFVHNEQDALIIRSIADSAGVGKTASPEQIKRMQETYNQQAGGKLSDDHLNEVLRVRDGRNLSSEELARAERLKQSFKDNAPVGEAFAKAKDSFAVTQRESRLLNQPEGAKKLIARLESDEGANLKQHLFGGEPPKEVQDLMAKVKDGTFKEDEAKQILQKQFDNRSNELTEFQRQRYQKYLGNEHEQDALVIGKEVRAKAEARGMGDAGPAEVETARFLPGDKAKVGTRDVHVLEQRGDTVAIIEQPPTGPIEGRGLKVSDDELGRNFEKIEVGETAYYRKGSDYYRLNEKGELVQDFDVTVAKRSDVAGIPNSDVKQLVKKEGFQPGKAVSADLKKQLVDGVEIEDARDVLDKLREVDDPVITIPMKYYDQVMKAGYIEAHETAIGHKLIAGTIGVEPLEKAGELRFVVRVKNKDIEFSPRATGRDKQFHGVVVSNKDLLVIGRDIEIISVPDVDPSVMNKVDMPRTTMKYSAADVPADVVAAAPDAVAAGVPGEPKGFLQGDKVSVDGKKYQIEGFDPQTGNVVVRDKSVADDGSMLGYTANAEELAKNYQPVHAGNEVYYKNAQGEIFRKEDTFNNRMMLMPEPELKVLPRESLQSAQLLEAGAFRRERIKVAAEMNLREVRHSGSVPIQGPESAEVLINNQKADLQNGELHIGRSFKSADGTPQMNEHLRVSRDHATLRWNDKDQSFHYTDHSTHGTWIKREGSENFQFVKDQEVKLGRNDEVRLGSPDGPQLRLAGTPENQAATRRELRQVFFDGQEVKLRPGEPITVGRAHQDFGNSSDDVINSVVSRDHGTVGLGQDGKLVYTDHSVNGTFIKRAGSNDWEVVKAKSTTINPGDEVHLGSQNGPELKLTSVHGQGLQDGTVVFQRPGEDVWQRADGFREISDRGGLARIEDANGKVVTARDSAGTDRFYSYAEDGQLNRIEYSDGRVSERSKDSDVWKMSQADGSHTEWKGKIEVESDGSLKYTDAEGKQRPWREKVDASMEIIRENGRVDYLASHLDVEKPRLEKLAEANFAEPRQRQRFTEMMQKFEDRARRAGVSDQEIADTYHQINRLITAGSEAPIPQGQRVRLAEQILQQAGAPTSIDQGFNNTCNVATVEARIFSREPSEAARLITDVATTGKYVAADGRVVDLGRVPGLLNPDGESLMSLNRPFDPRYHEDIKVDARRTYASQLFEMTAVNLTHAAPKGTAPEVGVVMYEKHPSAVRGDSGELLVKYTPNADGTISKTVIGKAPEIGGSQLEGVHNQITGGTDKGFVIRGTGWNNVPRPTVVEVASAADFATALQQMERDKNFPAILMVDTRHPPFTQVINDPAAGGAGGAHVVTIEGIYTGRDGRLYVEFSNQWGSQYEHLGSRAVAADDLFIASKPYNPRPASNRP